MVDSGNSPSLFEDPSERNLGSGALDEGIGALLSGDVHATITNRMSGTQENGVALDGDGRTPRYTGVQWDKKGVRWRARLHTDRTRHVGYFSNEEDAAKAWDQAMLRYSSDKDVVKKLNFPEESFARFQEFLNHDGDFEGFELKGVMKDPSGGFRASVLVNRQQTDLGLFNTAKEAARAYDWKSIGLFGWGALTNFPLAKYEMEYINNGFVSPFDGNRLPAFPNQRRFTESGKALQGMNGDMQQVNKKVRLDLSDAVPQIPFQAMDPSNGGLSPELISLMKQSGMPFAFNPFCLLPGMMDNQLFASAPGMQASTAEPDLKNTSNMFQEIQEIGANQWRVSVDLGVFQSKEDAQAAYDKCALALRGYSSISSDELQMKLHQKEEMKRKLSDTIVEKNGTFYVMLLINGRKFELGPYTTRDNAEKAHDKYKLILEGAKSDVFNPLIDLLLSKDEADGLLSALHINRVDSAAAAAALVPPPEGGAAMPHHTQSDIMGSFLRHVASHTSLHKEGQELNKQLEKIESSIEAIQGQVDLFNMPKPTTSNPAHGNSDRPPLYPRVE